MRLDKFLKVSRLIKRRSVAKQLADADRIVVNGRIAKPSLDLKVDDIIEITFKDKTTKYQVLKLVDHIKKDDSDSMFKMID